MIKLYVEGIEVEVKFWTFPAGERGVKIVGEILEKEVQIKMDFKGSNDLIDLALLVDALREMYINNIELFCHYFPYARQDRKCNEGESFSLRVICNFINSLGFKQIMVTDAHSSVLAAFFPAGVLCEIPQSHAVLWTFHKKPEYIFCSPDAGALKKIYKLHEAGWTNSVIEAGKVRDLTTGKILRSCILQGPDAKCLPANSRILVIDDICDGGATFIELAKVLNKEYPGVPLDLYVTHGIFSKGKEVICEYYDNIYCYNDLSEVQ